MNVSQWLEELELPHNPSPPPPQYTADSVPPAGEWTRADLAYFHIEPTPVDIETFFRMPEENLREIDWADPGYKAFLDAKFLDPYSGEGAAAQTVGRAMQLLRRMNLIGTSLPHSPDLSTGMNQNADTYQLIELLHIFLGMDKLGELIPGQPTKLLMSGHLHDIKMDVALVNRSYPSYSLLFVEDRYVHFNDYMMSGSPFARLMAAAIANFQSNNKIRSLHKQKEYNHMIFPVVTFLGSYPCFYLIHVTRALADAVARGISPDFNTKVPFLLLPDDYEVIGRLGLVYPSARKQALKIMENMKDYIPLGLEHIPDAWKQIVTEAEITTPYVPRD